MVTSQLLRHVEQNQFHVRIRNCRAHTHVAHEGEFELDGFPHLLDWLGRIAAETGHLKIGDAPEGALAKAALS